MDITVVRKSGAAYHLTVTTLMTEEKPMVIDLDRIERLERQLKEAKAELAKEDGERYRILMREMSEVDRNRILGNLTDKGERILFGLEAAEEPKKRSGMRPGGAGGDLVCDVCGKSGLTAMGLGLHKVRLHKVEKDKEEDEAA